jgi:hypothetical protein
MEKQPCKICKHLERHEIDNALLAGTPIQVIAKHYNLTTHAIRDHKEKCVSYTLSLDEFDRMVATRLGSVALTGEPETVDASLSGQEVDNATIASKQLTEPGSIRRQINLREADHLNTALIEYVGTLKNLGKKINSAIDCMDPINPKAEEALWAKSMLSKQVCDMYVGIGENINKTVRNLAEINQLLNGPTDNPLSGLQALATAINRSAAQPTADTGLQPTMC